MVYVILGVVKLIRAGFVHEFNHAWAEAFNEQHLNLLEIAALILLMLLMLVWCWLWWPMVLVRHQREQAERDAPQPWWV